MNLLICLLIGDIDNSEGIILVFGRQTVRSGKTELRPETQTE